MFSEASLVFAVFFPRGAEQQLSKASMKKKKKDKSIIFPVPQFPHQ